MKILSHTVLGVALALQAQVSMAQSRAAMAPITLSIEPQSMEHALQTFAKQSGLQVIFPTELAKDLMAPPVEGSYTPDAALNLLLRDSHLSYEFINARTVAIRPPKLEATSEATSLPAQGSAKDGVGLRVAQVDAFYGSEGESQGGDQKSSSEDRDVNTKKGIAEILVMGSKSQNVDIQRTEDDAQPYVIFSSEEIAQSGATSLEDFLRARLPMNTQAQAFNQIVNGPNASNVSAINLRGLGVNQTLILVDGRRAPRLLTSGGYDVAQGDINGMPLSTIERIEVLPSTAGAIYGGGAVGGVINIVRKRDYHGIDLRLGHDGTFRGGGGGERAELSGGFSPNGGTTQISLSGSYTKTRPLYVSDNDLWRRGRERYLELHPDGYIWFQGSTPAIQAEPDFSSSVPFGTAGATCYSNVCYATPNLVFDDGTPLNATRTFVPLGYAGVESDGVAGLIANAGKFNIDLPADGLGSKAVLRNGPSVWSTNLNLRHTFNDSIDAFADFSVTDNLGRSTFFYGVGNIVFLPADAANNPFQQDIEVSLSSLGVTNTNITESRSIGGSAGLIAKLGAGWSSSLEYDWNRSRYSARFTFFPFTLFNPVPGLISGGAFDVIRDLKAHPIDLSSYLGPSPDNIVHPQGITQQIASGRISGPLFELAGGAVNLTSLVERRAEETNLGVEDTIWAFNTRAYQPPRNQHVNSAYVEVSAPFVSARNAFPLIQALQLEASLRYDAYKTTGANAVSASATDPLPTFPYRTGKLHATSYKIATRWSPVADLALRGSFSTGFLPASISQVTNAQQPGYVANQDPKRGDRALGAEVDYISVIAGNPDLTPELSKSYSFGVILTPSFAPRLRVSADYTRIAKTDEISQLDAQYFIDHEADFPGRIVRGPNLSGDPAGFAGPIVYLDTSLLNISKSRVQAWDFQLDYDFDLNELGRVHLYSVATHQTEFRRQILPDSPFTNSVDFIDGPLEWRGNAGADWQLNGLRLAWNAQCYSGYSYRSSGASDLANDLQVVEQGAERVPSQIYHDLFANYDFRARTGSLLSGVMLSAGIQNIFDTRPPVIASYGITGYSPYGDARLRRFTISFTKHLGI